MDGAHGKGGLLWELDHAQFAESFESNNRLSHMGAVDLELGCQKRAVSQSTLTP